MRLSSLRSLSCLSSFATCFSSAAAAGRAGAAASAHRMASTSFTCLIFPRRGQMMPRLRPVRRAPAVADASRPAERPGGQDVRWPSGWSQPGKLAKNVWPVQPSSRIPISDE